MDDPGPVTSHDGTHPSRRRSVTVAAVVGAVVIVLVAVAVLTLRAGWSDGDGAPVSGASIGTSAAGGASASSVPTATGPSSATTDTALVSLEPFFAAAATMDQQLHAAAERINGAGPPWDVVADEVAASVRAADLGPVAVTIPAGMPRDLLGSVVLVYSDLVSRRAAMETFSFAWTREPDAAQPDSMHETSQLLQDLKNGAPAAARFDGDLAAVRTRAASTPAFTVQPAFTVPSATSREAVELTLLLRAVNVSNYGCAARGGYVMTDLWTVVWTSDLTGELRDPALQSGEGAIPFRFELGRDGRWDVQLLVC